MSEGYPYFSIAQKYNISYINVLEYVVYLQGKPFFFDHLKAVLSLPIRLELRDAYDKEQKRRRCVTHIPKPTQATPILNRSTKYFCAREFHCADEDIRQDQCTGCKAVTHYPEVAPDDNL